MADDMIELRIDAEGVYLKLPLNLENLEIMKRVLKLSELKLEPNARPSKKREEG